MIQQILEKARLYLPEARPFLPHAAALLVFAVLGWMNGLFQATRTVDNPNLKETWSVPTWTPYHTGPERIMFASLDIWDGKKPQSAAAKEAPKQDWRFIDTVQAGKAYAAVILLSDGKRIQRATTGDTLPNGEKIVAVGHGSMQIDVSGTQQEIKLFKLENKQEKK